MSELELALGGLGIEIQCAYVGEMRENDWNHDRWRVTLTRQGFTHATEYSTGLGHRRKRAHPLPAVPVAPTLADVVHSLILDASSGILTFDDFCDEFGYGSDSRKALRTWEACVDAAGKVRRLLGADFDHLAALEH